MIEFLKEIFEKVNFEKCQQTTTKHEKIPSKQRVKLVMLHDCKFIILNTDDDARYVLQG